MLDCVMLDVGGTFVKHSAVENGEFTAPGLFPINENGTLDEILQPIVAHLKANPTSRVSISIPGPMDYATGTSHMMHKFKAIKEVSLLDALQKEFPDTQFCFLHDGAAFMLGEAFYGASSGVKNAVGVMLGTGLGFVLWQDGKVQMRPEVLTPSYPLWSARYKDGTAEDMVSARGMRARWTAMTGETIDVKEIADRAHEGDEQAKAFMHETGRMLGEMLNDHLKGFMVEKIVIGGQIAKSLDLMEEGFREMCSIPVCRAQNVEDAALRGAWAYACHGMDLYQIVEGT
ncbi:MAG: ROK family protein [Clostridia bacterium]|nr:ROK family protein [Clostridia bacterium]